MKDYYLLADTVFYNWCRVIGSCHARCTDTKKKGFNKIGKRAHKMPFYVTRVGSNKIGKGANKIGNRSRALGSKNALKCP